MTLTIPAPGIYDDIPDDLYHSHDSLSSTGARRILECPAKYKHERDNPTPTSATFNFGHAAHSLILGAGKPLVKLSYDDLRSKAAREERDNILNDGGIPLKTAEWDQVHAMALAIRNHPRAIELLTDQSAKAERSIFWTDPDTSVWCRARPDLTVFQKDTISLVDYKTTIDASQKGFEKSIGKYGYHQQAAWYIDGMNIFAESSEMSFTFIAQEKTAPYLVNVIQLDEYSIQAGHRANRRALNTYKTCKKSNYWPGYGTEIIIGSVPAWAVEDEGQNCDY